MLGKLGDGRAERSPRAGNEERMLPGPAGEAYLASGTTQKELLCSCMTSQQQAILGSKAQPSFQWLGGCSRQVLGLRNQGCYRA